MQAQDAGIAWAVNVFDCQWLLFHNQRLYMLRKTVILSLRYEPGETDPGSPISGMRWPVAA